MDRQCKLTVLDFQNLEGLQANHESAAGSKAEDDSAKRAAVDKARLHDEVSQLKELIESSRAAKREAMEQCETMKQEVESAKQHTANLQDAVQTLENDKSEVS